MLDVKLYTIVEPPSSILILREWGWFLRVSNSFGKKVSIKYPPPTGYFTTLSPSQTFEWLKEHGYIKDGKLCLEVTNE